MNLFPMGNYFTAATKRVISSMQSFTKKISGKKGKYSEEIVLYSVNIVEISSDTQTFPMYANFAPDDARQSDVIHTLFFTVARHQCGHLQRSIYTKIHTYIHIYKYIFRLNSRGLAPLGPARPNKFINLATLRPSALASRGIMMSLTRLIHLFVHVQKVNLQKP